MKLEFILIKEGDRYLMTKELFVKWLEETRNISQNSIDKYSRSINITESELESYGLQETSLYGLTDTKFIDTIIENPIFEQKDKRGHRMYSVALKHLKNFIENYYSSSI